MQCIRRKWPHICNLLTWLIFFLSLGRCQRRTTSGKCCVLPFVYRGRRYTNCARSKRGRPWCPTASSVYKRNQPWGYCRGGKRKYQLSTEVAYLSSSFPLSLYPVFFFFPFSFFPFAFLRCVFLRLFSVEWRSTSLSQVSQYEWL